MPAAESPTGAPLVLLSNEVSGTVTAYAVGGRPATPLTPASPFAFGDFDADGRGDDRGEVVEVTNTSADLSLALLGGTFVVLNPFSERVTYAAPLDAVVEPGETFVLATSGGNLDLPAGTLPDGPGAFALVQGSFGVGASVRDVLGSVVAAVVYLDEDRVFGRRAGGGGECAGRVRPRGRAPPGGARRRRAHRPRAVTTAPNPTRGRTTVGVRTRRGRPRPRGRVPTRSAAAWPSSPTARSGRGGTRWRSTGRRSPAGAYVVRVEGAEARTARVTVVR